MDNISKVVVAEALKVDSYLAYNFSSHFENLEKSLDGGSEASLLEIYGIIRNVCQFLLQPKQPSPFAPMWEMQGKRSMIPDDLSDEQLDKIATLTDINLPPTLMARLCDILWLRRRDHIFARKAIISYLDIAENCVDEHWPYSADCARRAVRIANGLGRKAPERNTVCAKLLELFEFAINAKYQDNRRHWPHAAAEILVDECQNIDYVDIANKCQMLGDSMVDAWTKEGYYELAANAFAKAHLPEERKKVLNRLGECWEQEADKFRTQEGGNGMQIAHRLEKAINAFRKAGESESAERALRGFQQANKLTITQMKPLRVKFDMTRFLNDVEKQMAGKIGCDALEAFIKIRRIESFASAYKAAQEEANKPSIRKFADSTSLVEEGNISARREGGLEASASDVIQELVNRYSLSHSISAALLEKARIILLKDNKKTWVDALKSLVQQNEFVPEDRQNIYFRAIVAGVDGDWLLFAHLIIPQLENSLRQLVGLAGGKTTAYRSDLMKERDLNQFLTENEPGKDVITLIGEDLTWELRTLLIEQSGANLRNRICHGLASEEECNGCSIIILLWLTLVILSCTEQYMT